MLRDIFATNAWSFTMTFFTVISSQFVETKYCPRYELYCDDQTWNSNSCCDHHLLGRQKMTDRKCRDQVSDQELSAKQNVTKHVIDPPTVWVLPLIISVVYVCWFELRFQSWVLVTETVTGKHCHSQKKIMIMLAPALSSTYQSEYGVGHKHSHVVFGMSWRTFIEYQQWASSNLGYVHCFRWCTSRDAQYILQHWPYE